MIAPREQALQTREPFHILGAPIERLARRIQFLIQLDGNRVYSGHRKFGGLGPEARKSGRDSVSRDPARISADCAARLESRILKAEATVGAKFRCHHPELRAEHLRVLRILHVAVHEHYV